MPNHLTNAPQLKTSTGAQQYTPVPGGHPMNYDQLYLSYGMFIFAAVILICCWIPEYSKMKSDLRLLVRIIGPLVAIPLMVVAFMLYGGAYVGGFIFLR